MILMGAATRSVYSLECMLERVTSWMHLPAPRVGERCHGYFNLYMHHACMHLPYPWWRCAVKVGAMLPNIMHAPAWSVSECRRGARHAPIMDRCTCLILDCGRARCHASNEHACTYLLIHECGSSYLRTPMGQMAMFWPWDMIASQYGASNIASSAIWRATYNTNNIIYLESPECFTFIWSVSRKSMTLQSP